MRVIGGIFKSRRLASIKSTSRQNSHTTKSPHAKDHFLKGSYLRPTSDRVKESIFNILADHLNGAIVLDLFAGTGSLSIEALSRGAKYIIAIENNTQSLKIINKNLNNLQITQREICVLKKDVFTFLKRYNKSLQFDLVFIDPPFTQKLADLIMKQLTNSTVLKREATVVIESTRYETIADSYGQLCLLDRRDFGDKWVSFFQVKNL